MARPEQTEKPTPKRRAEARGRGQVARSGDVAPAFILLAAIMVLHFGFQFWVGNVAQMVRVAFNHVASSDTVNIFSAWGYFVRSFSGVLPMFVIFFIIAFVIGYLANVLQFGFLFTTYPIKPKFSKLNPLNGIANVLFSKQTAMQLVKQLLKLGAVSLIIFLTVKDNLPTIYDSARNSPHDWMVAIEGMIYGVALRFSLFLVALALLDYAFQRWQVEESLKMSRVEVKDEMRQSEGNPELRQAVKARQRAVHRRRMMAAVPKATVVVTNPTHFACALEWDEVTMEAPVLSAKGADLMARRIRELAREHAVPIVENPTLARTLYYRVELDQPVPPELYAATAQVIAFVYRLKRKTIA